VNKYKIELQNNILGGYYWSLLKYPNSSGRVEILGDYESLKEATDDKKYLEEKEKRGDKE